MCRTDKKASAHGVGLLNSVSASLVSIAGGAERDLIQGFILLDFVDGKPPAGSKDR